MKGQLAGVCLIEETSGRVTTPLGKPWSVHSGAYVATSAHLKSRILKFFRT